MKTIFTFISLALVGLLSAQITTRLIDLRVDHFNPLDRRSFDARYMVNRELWYPGGPIFIFVGGFSEVDDEFLVQGAMYDIAEETNAILFSLEHRYFGESRPTEDTSVENLRWLTIHQALADLAQFISFIKVNYYGTANSPVILWGRNYGGSLAVWARQKYPNLVDGVWASSAPINAVVEYPQFMSNVFATINSIGGPECGNILHGAFRMIEDAVRNRDTAYVEERLRLCSPIDVDIEEDVAKLVYSIARDIGYNFVSNARYPDIDDMCTLMRGLNTPENPADNDLDAFARWFVDEHNGNLECLNYNNAAVIATYQQVEWNTDSTNSGRRQSFWMYCTQIAQLAIANEGVNHPFGWRFDFAFFRHWCAQAYDPELFTQDFIEESVARTNQFFGGLNPQVYRVFFTHGEMDPIRSLGPSVDINEQSPVVVMSLQSSGRDFGSASDTDYAVLHQTKAKARELIIRWIFEAIGEIPTETTTGPDPETPAPAFL